MERDADIRLRKVIKELHDARNHLLDVLHSEPTTADCLDCQVKVNNDNIDYLLAKRSSQIRHIGNKLHLSDSEHILLDSLVEQILRCIAHDEEEGIKAYQQRDHLQELLDTERAQHAKAVKDIDALQGINLSQANEIADLHRSLHALENRLDETNEEFDRLANLLNYEQETLATTQRDLDIANARIEELNNALEAAENENSTLRYTFDAIQDWIQETQRVLGETQEEV